MKRLGKARIMSIGAVVSVGALGTTLAGGPAYASTSTKHRTVTITVNTQFTDPGMLTDPQGVRCGYAQPGVCELEFGGHSSLTGTLTGWTDYTAWARGNADGSQTWYAYETFTGTIEGCGRGTFDFVVENGTVSASPDANDPLARDVAGDWSLEPGSGTGDLARVVSLTGAEHSLIYPDTSTKGSFTGTITCAL